MTKAEPAEDDRTFDLTLAPLSVQTDRYGQVLELRRQISPLFPPDKVTASRSLVPGMARQSYT
jgi:hypothetical protein